MDRGLSLEARLESCRSGAPKGSAKAENSLGLAYLDGREAEKDYAEARNWFELAVVNYDLAVARLNLVLMYFEGDGVEQDEATTLKWLLKAAGNGEVDAQCNFGVKYAHGKGV